MKALIPLPEWTIVLAFAFGAIVGSFLNVVIYRMPRAISIWKESRSFCPICKHHLNGADLFPLFSWLFSGRKCRHCGEPVSSRYFWVELTNALIWMGIWYIYLLGPTPDLAKALTYSLTASALVAIIFVDIELYLIPDQINAFILFVGFGYNIWLYSEGSSRATLWGMPSSVAGALVGTAVLWGIAFLGRVAFGKDAMGHGDIKMARGVGAVLLPGLAVMSFGLAVFLGAIIGGIGVIVRMVRARNAPGSLKPNAQEEEPYVPESIGSLLKCGVGYFLCLDAFGLFVPRFYIWYFAENPFEPPEDLETFEADRTVIPFGPFLALGAILAAIFEKQLLDAANAYLHNMGATPAIFLEHFLTKT